MEYTFEINDSSCPEQASQARRLIGESLARANCHSRLVFRVMGAVTEAIANAMVHGNRMNPERSIRVSWNVTRTTFEAEVIDEGDGFIVTAIANPVLPEHLRKPGGRGIAIMRFLMDEVVFNDRGNGVLLRLSDIASPGRSIGQRPRVTPPHGSSFETVKA